MIRSRRQAHRTVFRVLSFGLPVLLVASVALRSETPSVSATAAPLFDQAGFALDHRAEEVTLRPDVSILRPDVLIYWTAQSTAVESLPDDAVLVGSLASTSARRLALPEEASGGDGAVLLYSLGHQEVVARIPLHELRARPQE